MKMVSLVRQNRFSSGDVGCGVLDKFRKLLSTIAFWINEAKLHPSGTIIICYDSIDTVVLYGGPMPPSGSKA